MREFCERRDLPAPSGNQSLLGMEIDFCWPAYRVIVETDGWEIHRTRMKFEEDRRRDAALVVAGWRVVRITKARLLHDASTLARELRVLLSTPVAEYSSHSEVRSAHRGPAIRGQRRRGSRKSSKNSHMSREASISWVTRPGPCGGPLEPGQVWPPLATR